MLNPELVKFMVKNNLESMSDAEKNDKPQVKYFKNNILSAAELAAITVEVRK